MVATSPAFFSRPALTMLCLPARAEAFDDVIITSRPPTAGVAAAGGGPADAADKQIAGLAGEEERTAGGAVAVPAAGDLQEVARRVRVGAGVAVRRRVAVERLGVQRVAEPRVADQTYVGVVEARVRGEVEAPDDVLGLSAVGARAELDDGVVPAGAAPRSEGVVARIDVDALDREHPVGFQPVVILRHEGQIALRVGAAEAVPGADHEVAHRAADDGGAA